MKSFLTILAAIVMCSCFTESAQAQNCGNGRGYYSARPVVAVGYAPRGGYGYRGPSVVRSSSFYRGPSFGGVSVGSRYLGPSFYRGGYSRYGGFGGFGGVGGYGRYGGFGPGIGVGGRGISIGIGF